MSTLGKKQRTFSLAIGRLIIYAYSIGYELSFGDAYRSPDVPYGHINSCHRHRLAVDFNLFKDGNLIDTGEGHDVLHDYWDLLGGSARIMGDFGHYSFEHNGVR